MKNKGCKAVYCGGQMYCTECGVTWHLDDEHAECQIGVKKIQLSSTYGKFNDKKTGTDALTKIKENLNRE